MKIAITLLGLPLLASLAAAQLGRPSRVPLEVRVTSLAAEVRIVDGVATTILRETIRNDGRRQVEADWILPLPEGAVADQFKMTVDGVQVAGEVLPADGARRVYEDIVRRRRDPGLLEYMGRGCLRARIFPIPAQGEVTVEIGYRQILPEIGGVRHWSFPVAAAGIDGRAPEHVVLDLSLRSRRPIRNAFSPVGGVQVIQKGDHEARASFEGRADEVPHGELAVMYGLSDKEFGLDLLSTRVAGEAEGTFLMLISPKRALGDEAPIPKSITFVIDTSGSMAGDKIQQARGALHFFLSSLREGDRFNVVPFATEPEPFFPGPVHANAENIDTALARAETLRANGGTNIAHALRDALRTERDSERVPIVVFLTDGLPTVEVTDPNEILKKATEWNTNRSRVFAFGVGDDVNTHLLDKLAGDNGGTRHYVREDQDIEVETSDLFTKLSRPVLTDLTLAVEGLELLRVVPSELPDLFAGGRLAVFGRYRGEGPRAIRLSGSVGGERRQYIYEGTFAKEAVADFEFVRSLWAERRVGMLLDQIRLHESNQELVDEVQRLGTQYRIVTPYTSHLIVEDGLRLGMNGAGHRGAGDTVPPGGGGGGGGPIRRPAPGPVTPGAAGSMRGSRGPGSPGPGSPGPGSPGLGSPGPASPGPSSPGSAPGSAKARTPEPSLDQIAERLRDAGVLPNDATREELRVLASEIADELRSADRALRGLGRESTGRAAVDDSAYLAMLVGADAGNGVLTGSDDFFLGHGSMDSARIVHLLARFTRKVKDKIFDLRGGVWVDRGLPAETDGKRTVVEAYSREYFALLRAEPKLAPYFAFSERMVVALEGNVYEVRLAKSDKR